MTAAYEFELAPAADPREIAARIEQLWVGHSVNVLANFPSPGRALVSLRWHFDLDQEAAAVTAIVGELFALSRDVHYYRCFDTIGDAHDFNRSISLAELLTPGFLPSLHNGPRFATDSHTPRSVAEPKLPVVLHCTAQSRKATSDVINVPPNPSLQRTNPGRSPGICR
jgi:hypothetical protein